MKNLNSDEIKDLISIDTFNDTSLFTVTVIDLENYQILYTNQAMKNIMSDMTAENCWEAIHGQESPCMWCKAPQLLNSLLLSNSKRAMNDEYITYENFNEVANKWYQLQEKVVRLKDSRVVLVSFALDISMQKEAQSNLIDTHVKLTKQTQELQRAKQELKELVSRDPLTNAYNRRYFSEVASKLIPIGRRKEEPISVLMIDIDKFKKINDTYGHSAGDEVIKTLAIKLQSSTRESDIVARFGGEEFAIILPNTDKKSALTIAESIREEIEESHLDLCPTTPSNELIKFTISIGVDEFNYTTDGQIDNSLNRADKALYKAKNSGRNRVC